MSEHIIAEWTSSSHTDTAYTVIPDGCRDLIAWEHPEQKTYWYISPLFDHSKIIQSKANTKISGFRFKAGLAINEQKLIQSIKNNKFNLGYDDLYSIIEDCTHHDENISDALLCLKSDINTVKQAADELGVTVRTLQRLVKTSTGRTPTYWKNLARARKTARDILNSDCFSEIAYMNNYSDQAHMCREIKHWFKISPRQIKQAKYISEQLGNKAYC